MRRWLHTGTGREGRRQYLLFGVLLWLVGPLQAQVLRLESQRAHIGFSYGGSHRAGGVASPYTQQNFREWVVLPFTGWLVDPGVVRYGVEVQPELTQQHASGLPDPFRGRTLSYSGHVHLFSGRRVSFNASKAHTTGDRSGGFGTRASFQTTTLQAGMNVRWRWLPLMATYTQRVDDYTDQVGPSLTPVRRAVADDALRLTARNSKLQLRLEWFQHDDRLREGDFALRHARVDHRLRWGKGSQLRSRYQQSQRTGFFPYTRTVWDEYLRLQHARRLHSTFEWSRRKLENPAGLMHTSTYGGSLTAQASQNVQLGARGSFSASRFGEGRQRARSLGPWLGAQAALPGGLHFAFTGAVGFVHRSLDTRGSTYLQVLNERHVYERDEVLVLEQTGVDGASVQIFNADETLRYEPGLDYLLRTVGALLEIVVLPGSRIQEGDVLLIHYRYRPLVEGTEDGTFVQVSARVRWAGITLQHSRSRRDIDAEGLVATTDFRRHQTSLTAARRTPVGRLRLQLRRVRRVSTRQNYRSDEARLSWALPVLGRLAMTLEGAVHDLREGANRVTLYSARLAGFWPLTRMLRLQSLVQVQEWHQTPGDRRNLLSAQAALDYVIGRLQVRLRYGFDHQPAPFLTTGHQLSLYVVRRL